MLSSKRRAAARMLTMAAAVLTLLAGCGPRSKQEAAPAGDAAHAPEGASPGAPAAGAIFAAYEGTLPCADCGGIQTELTLYADGTRYALKQVYLATKDGDKKFDSEGTWTTTRGIASDPNAVVFVLAPGSSSESQRFLVTGDATIELLSKDGNRIESAHNHTLTRKEAPLDAR